MTFDQDTYFIAQSIGMQLIMALLLEIIELQGGDISEESEGHIKRWTALTEDLVKQIELERLEREGQN